MLQQNVAPPVVSHSLNSGVSRTTHTRSRRRTSMSDKTRLLHEADEEFTALRNAIDGLTDEEMSRVWLGSWGVREILMHISGWHQAMTPAFQHIARGEEPYAPGTYDDFDAWNARFVEQKAAMTPPEILTEL